MSELLLVVATAFYVAIGVAVARVAYYRGVESGLPEFYGIAWPATVTVYAGLRLGDYCAKRKEPK